MIILKVQNGVGNQLFVMALGELLRKNFPNQIIKYDSSELPMYVNGRYTITLDSFSSKAEMLTAKEVRSKLGKILFFRRCRSNSREAKDIVDILERKIIKVITLPQRYQLIVESKYEDAYDQIRHMQFDSDKDYVFDGYWEDVRFVLPIASRLKKIIDFPNVRIHDEYYSLIDQGMNLVSVHIRRGDYIKESNSISYPRYFYAICDEEYYEDAISLIQTKVENPFFVFFSDDIEYVREKYAELENKIIVEGQRDIEDLYFMTLCNHHVLANSTFSFWGAMLSKKSGVNVAPKTHYYRLLDKNNIYKKEFFFVDDWLYLDTKKIW